MLLRDALWGARGQSGSDRMTLNTLSRALPAGCPLWTELRVEARPARWSDCRAWTADHPSPMLGQAMTRGRRPAGQPSATRPRQPARAGGRWAGRTPARASWARRAGLTAASMAARVHTGKRGNRGRRPRRRASPNRCSRVDDGPCRSPRPRARSTLERSHQRSRASGHRSTIPWRPRTTHRRGDTSRSTCEARGGA
jgi:hypothetical protein